MPMMNPFSAISRFVRGPGFRKAAPFAAAGAAGATVPDAVGDLKAGYDETIRDDAAREIIGGIMDAQQQEALASQQQEALYMKGMEDAAALMGGAAFGDDGGYGDYLGSQEGMYSLAAAALPGAQAPGFAPGKPAPAGKAKGPLIPTIKLGSALHDVPGVLAEALGLDKQASATVIGAGVGAGLGAFADAKDLPSRLKNMALLAGGGALGGHVLSNPTTMNSLKGLFSTVKPPVTP